MSPRTVVCLLVLMTSVSHAARASDPPPAVDATTMHLKVLCGYQGWFRCPGDAADKGWRHWSRSGRHIAPDTLTFEMWPDLTDYGDDEKHAAPGFTYPDGAQAHLFSSTNPKTVDRHFRWMQQYGIDGIFLQRFVVGVGDPSMERVLENVRASAAATGRVYAICYDLSGAPPDKLYDRLVADWKRLVDEVKVTKDPQYLHERGKPVIFVWGFYPDRFSAAVAHRIIDFYRNAAEYGGILIGGCPWYWRREKDPEWARAFRRFDVISPWNVGNVTIVDGRKQANTGPWADDLAEARKSGMAYLPVIYPGFGWTNLKGKQTANVTISRLRGDFLWRQFTTAADLRLDMAYVAMFDEVDEGTAIFKVTNTPPTQAHFETFEGLPTDWYLRLTAEGSKVIRGERKPDATIPITP